MTVNSSSGRHLCVVVKPYSNGVASWLRMHPGAPSVTCAETCGSLATGPTQPKVRLSSPSLWSRDLSRPPLNLSAWVRIMIGSFAPSRDGDLSRVVGLSSSREATF